MTDINELKFDANGLIPAVVTDAQTGAVLMLAYMNRESLETSIREQRTCFWSRSRKELWRKGESSGNVQNIVSITTDCDKDALVIAVEKNGPACHTGEESCFHELMHGEEPFNLQKLYDTIINRKIYRKPGSYTTYLFDKGVDKILKKIGEESTEVVIAGKGGRRDETIYEISDLIYHVMVLMAEMGIRPKDIHAELDKRHGKKKEDYSE